MAANRATTCWAVPNFLLCLQETLHAIVPNGVQVFDHAHVVLRAVALIQAFQAFTGIVRAFEAEPYLTFCQQLATICHVPAVFPTGDAARAVSAVETFFVQVHLFELVGCAQSAIHTAWSNQFFVHFLSRRLLSGT